MNQTVNNPYRYVYKITCTAGKFKDKYYYGQHTTNNLDDGYKGSGVMLIKYYKKHPNDFIKEIVEYCSSKEELDDTERKYIQPCLNDELCLNLAPGGKGGDCISKHPQRNKIAKHHSNVMKDKKQTQDAIKARSEGMKGHIVTDETKRKISESHKGKKLSEEHRKHLSLSHIGKSPGNKGVPLTSKQKQYLSNLFKGKHRVYDNKELNKYHYE